MNGNVHGEWLLSPTAQPIGKEGAIGVKLDDRNVMWVGGNADRQRDSNRTFIYDVESRTFHEAAPIPVAKRMDRNVAVGVLTDGSVVVAGGDISASDQNSANTLSYRYVPRDDRWIRTGDLPKRQKWVFTPTTRLRDGRLLIAGGIGDDGIATGTGSRDAFVFDLKTESVVRAVDPRTGEPTGQHVSVQGSWDFTRNVRDHAVTRLGRGHVFGHAVLLHDGRVFVVGGHTFWKIGANADSSALATDTDFFDPTTGEWSTGAALPPLDGEDDRISGSHGGRANGVGVAVMHNGKVVIAGGTTQTDGAAYNKTLVARRSIVVMTAATNPMNSTYQTMANRIPPGTEFGGLFGDGGRSQLLCYPLTGNRVLLAGGQSSNGGDLYDTYVLDYETEKLTRGPDMAHGPLPPDANLPPGYQMAAISTRAVSMNNSKLSFNNGTLVHGGGYNPLSPGDAPPAGSRRVEQLHHDAAR